MLLSRTSQYAIQAMILIGVNGQGSYTSAREIGKWLHVPAPYLAKILQMLCRGGLLLSNRGRRGGFCLGIAAEKLNLLQVLSTVEDSHFNADCLLGLKECGDDAACPMHGVWKPIKISIFEMLESQTLAILAAAVRTGQYRLTDLPDVLIKPLLQPAS